MDREPQKFDVVVIGAGPAGSSCAIRLAVSGLNVLLVERSQFPRHKLCGEFISPEALEHFQELGISAEIKNSGAEQIVSTDFYAMSGRSISVDSAWFGGIRPTAIGLSRSAMDDLLLKRAKSVGVKVLESTIFRSVSRKGDGNLAVSVTAGSEPFDVVSPLVVDATGRSRVVCRILSKQAPEKADFVAFKAHFKDANIKGGHCEIYSYRGGYGGLNAVEGGVYNLCFIVSSATAKRYGSDPMRLVLEVIQKNRRAAEALRSAEPVTEWLAVPVTRYGRHDPAPEIGVLAIGDAAAFIDPFTGSGNLLALQSARLAAETIIRTTNTDELQREYRELHKAAFASRLNMAGMMRSAAYHPMIATATVAVLGLSRSFLRVITNRTRTSPEIV